MAVVFTAIAVLTFAVVPSADRWTDVGAVFTGGAFVFACIATVVALVAYQQSLRRPRLVLEAKDGIVPRDAEKPWRLGLTLRNNGEVAARFVAVRVTLENAEFKRVLEGEAWHLGSDSHVLQWEGGGDTIIHPQWEHKVPTIYARVTLSDQATKVPATVEVVADGIRTVTDRFVAYVEET